MGLLLNRKAAAALTDLRLLSSRLLRTDFADDNPLTLLVGYAHTAEHEAEQLAFEVEMDVVV